MQEPKEKVYPSWRYHKSEPARIVESAEEDAALGKGWADSPAAFEAAQAKPAAPVEPPPKEDEPKPEKPAQAKPANAKKA